MNPYIRVNEVDKVYFKVIEGRELTRKHIIQILSSLKDGVDNSLIVNGVVVPLSSANTVEEVYKAYTLAVGYNNNNTYRLEVN